METTINTGAILTEYFNLKRTRKAALARKIDRSPNAVLAFQKKESIQTAILLEISNALQHNFFMDIAQQLPTTYTTKSNIFAEKDTQIAQLQEENKLLKAEKEVLLKAFGRG